MIWTIFFLGFTGLNSIQSWDIIDNDQFDLLESWGITRVVRGTPEKIMSRFPDNDHLVCEEMHVTDEYPFIAIILFKTSGRFLCMGSIIDPMHVLSAKKCFERTDTTEILVIGGYYKPWWGHRSQVKTVQKVLRHENEIALLRLKTAFRFSIYVNPIRLPSTITREEMQFEKAWPPPYKVAGIPVDRFDVPGDYMDKGKFYRVLEDHFLAFDECKKNYTRLVLEPANLFCTIGNATYCWGGWGAPVIKMMVDNYYLQVGVVIADNCTADSTGPFLCARTDVFGDWINGNSYRGHQPS